MPAYQGDEPGAGGKKIEKLISQTETFTELLSLNGSREPLQEEDKKEKAAANKRCKLCRQFQKNPILFMGTRKECKEWSN